MEGMGEDTRKGNVHEHAVLHYTVARVSCIFWEPRMIVNSLMISSAANEA